MKKNFQTLLCTLILCTMFFTAFSGKEVQAAAKAPSCPKSQIVYGYVESGSKSLITSPATYSSFIYIKNLAPGAVFSNFKSSNKNIGIGNMAETFRMDAVALSINKPQKDGARSKISFTIKQNGKKYNLSCNVTFKKAKSPFKSLKIGNKEYASSFKGGITSKTVKFSNSKSAKITYTPAAGFKIKYIEVTYRDWTTKRIKNGEKVNLKNVASIKVRFGVTKKPTYYSTPGESAMWGFSDLPLSSEECYLSAV